MWFLIKFINKAIKQWFKDNRTELHGFQALFFFFLLWWILLYMYFSKFVQPLTLPLVFQTLPFITHYFQQGSYTSYDQVWRKLNKESFLWFTHRYVITTRKRFPNTKQVFVEWMDILLQSFHQGRRQNLTKSILTLIAQIHLENTKEDTDQSKFLRTRQLALIISEMKKAEKARGKEREQSWKSPMWRNTSKDFSSPTDPWRQRRRRGSMGTHLSSPGGTPPEAAPASRCARTDTEAQTLCAPSGPGAPGGRARAAAACSSLCSLSPWAPHRATEAWSKNKRHLYLLSRKQTKSSDDNSLSRESKK